MPFEPLEASRFVPLAPAEDVLKTDRTALPDDTSPAVAFGKAAGESAVKTVATLPAMIAGAQSAAALTPPILPGVGPFAKPIAAVVGGLGGALVAGGAYDKIKEFASEYVPQGLAEFVGLDKATRQKEMKQNPEATFAGGLAGGFVAFRPGSVEAVQIAKDKFLTSMQQRLGMGAISAGMETAGQLQSDKPMDPLHIAAAGAVGAVAAKPTKLTQRVGGIFTPHEPIKDPGPTEWTTPAGEAKPRVNTPEVPMDAKTLENGLYTLKKAKEADQSVAQLRMKAMEEDGVTSEMREKWGQHTEGEVQLTAPEKALYDKYVAPELAERKLLIEHAQKEGYVLPTELDPAIAGENSPRIQIPKPVGFWEELFGGQNSPLDVNIAKTPGGAQERSFFVWENANGSRTVVQRVGDVLLKWEGGKAAKFANADALVDGKLKAGDTFGSGRFKEARTSEIESNTPAEYVKDHAAVVYSRLTELREFVRNNDFLASLKESPYFKGSKDVEAVAHKVETGKEADIPEGFRTPEHLEKLPQFHGYVFEPRAAAIIEDFAKTWEPNALSWISQALIKNMMLNPFPHMNNEAWHWYLARGLTGWTTPAGVSSFAHSFPKAMSEVFNQGPLFREMMRNGASTLSNTPRNNAIHDAIFQNGLKEVSKTATWKKIAEAVSTPPKAFYNAVSKASGKAMWTVRDAMYMQMVIEKMNKGMDMKSSIHEVERHMPSYRLPTHVGEAVLGETLSRGLSKVLQNPNVTIFSRYHHGMVKSQLETLRDVAAIRKGKEGFENFKHGIDTVAAAAVAVAIFYPMLDAIAASITGNKHAEQRRAGPFHVWDAIAKTLSGEKDAFSITAGLFTFNPALLASVQLLINKELYSGQNIYHVQDKPKQIASDIGMYAAKQVPQVSTSLRVNSERGGGLPQFAAQQLDIKAPSQKQVDALKKRMHKEEVAAKERERKRRREGK